NAAIILGDEQIVIFRKRHRYVADLSCSGGPHTTRGHGTIGKGEVEDVEEGFSQPPAMLCSWRRFLCVSVRCVRAASDGSGGWNGGADRQACRRVRSPSRQCHGYGDKYRQRPSAK